MINLHVQIIKNKGRKEYVVLPYDEFLRVQEELEDLEDLRLLKEAKEADTDAPSITMGELKKRLARKKNREIPQAAREVDAAALIREDRSR